MDGKDFVISKNYLSNVNDNLDNYSKRVNKQLSNKKIMSYYNKYKLDSYYEELFNDLINNFSYFGTESSFDKEIDYIKNFVKNIDNVITFLIDNKDYWNIVNYNIEFKNNEKLKEFELLISKVTIDDNTSSKSDNTL